MNNNNCGGEQIVKMHYRLLKKKEKRQEKKRIQNFESYLAEKSGVLQPAAAEVQRVLVNSTYSMSLSANSSFVVHMDRPPNEVLASRRTEHDLISSFCNHLSNTPAHPSLSFPFLLSCGYCKVHLALVSTSDVTEM